MNHIAKVNNDVAKSVFPKLIGDGKDFILITMNRDENDDVDVQLRCGGALLLNEDKSLSIRKLYHYLKCAIDDIEEYNQDELNENDIL